MSLKTKPNQKENFKI